MLLMSFLLQQRSAFITKFYELSLPFAFPSHSFRIHLFILMFIFSIFSYLCDCTLSLPYLFILLVCHFCRLFMQYKYNCGALMSVFILCSCFFLLPHLICVWFCVDFAIVPHIIGHTSAISNRPIENLNKRYYFIFDLPKWMGCSYSGFYTAMSWSSGEFLLVAFNLSERIFVFLFSFFSLFFSQTAGNEISFLFYSILYTFRNHI